MKSKKFITFSLVALCLTSCQINEMPFVYHPTKQQGNMISQDHVAQLKIGQSKQQVLDNMGTPLLTNPFTADKWAYVYQYQAPRKPLVKKSITLIFADDQLTKVIK